MKQKNIQSASPPTNSPISCNKPNRYAKPCVFEHPSFFRTGWGHGKNSVPSPRFTDEESRKREVTLQKDVECQWQGSGLLIPTLVSFKENVQSTLKERDSP